MTKPINEITTVQMELTSGNVDALTNKLKTLDLMAAAIKENLVKGQDYMTIPGTGKPSLLAPGAQKINLLYGIEARYQLLPTSIVDVENGFALYVYKCTLIHRESGKQVAEATASANTKEKACGTMKFHDALNQREQIAQKRAYVRATREVGNLSKVFTQDIEELKQEPLGKFDAMKLIAGFGQAGASKKPLRDALGAVVVDRFNAGKDDEDKILTIMTGATAHNKNEIAGIVKRVALEYKDGRLPIELEVVEPKAKPKKTTKKVKVMEMEHEVIMSKVANIAQQLEELPEYKKNKRNVRDYIKRKKGNVDAQEMADKYLVPVELVREYIERYK